MGDKMLINRLKILQFLNKILTIISILMFCVLFTVKYSIYNKKISIRSIDNDISKLLEEKTNLNTELAYLSSPSRLKTIYNFIKDNKNIIQDKQIVNDISFSQIKTLSSLEEYFIKKYGSNGKIISYKK